MLPTFLIIGVARGGTGWLYNNVRPHPEIFMPSRKEIHFFDKDYHKGMGYYERYFHEVGQEKAVGEATPAYLHKPEVTERIHQHLDQNIKFIISLRNPVERLYSRFWNAKTRFKTNKGVSFEEKIKQKPQFIEEGYYIDHINRYLQYYDKDQFLFLLHDDIKKSPKNLLKSIYAFLEVDTAYESPLLDAKINSAKSRPSTGKNPMKYYSSKVIKKLGLKGLAYQMEKTNMVEYPPMNADTKKWLVQDIYGEKNTQLQTLIGKDISHWNAI